jgi:multidrug efflux system outer membrane protein
MPGEGKSSDRISHGFNGGAADFLQRSAADSQNQWARRPCGTALAGMMAILLAGCAATPPPDATGLADVGEVPDAFAKKQGAIGEETGSDRKSAALPLADHEWVAKFGDAQLESLVAEGLERNKDLKIAAARVETAAANTRIAGADLYPQMQGLFRGSRQKRSFIGFPIGGSAEPDAAGGSPGESTSSSSILSSQNNEFGLSLDLSWEIDLWGRIRAGRGAFLADQQATEADRAAAELSIAGRVAKAWFALREAKEQTVLAEKTVLVFQNTEKAVRDRFEAGVAEAGQNLASQLRLAVVDIEMARENLEGRRESVKQASRAIEALLGRYPAAAIDAKGGLPKVPGAPPAGMPGDLLDRRPDLRAAERRLAAADRRLVEAKRALLPAISISGSAGTATEQIEDLLDSNFSIWSLAGNAAQPILNGGRLREGIVLRKADIGRAAAEFEKTALTAFGEVENALSNESSLAKREASLRAAALAAKEAYGSAGEEFAAGTGDLLTMLTAQNRWFQQEQRLISMRRQRLDNRVDLHLALGGSSKVVR